MIGRVEGATSDAVEGLQEMDVAVGRLPTQWWSRIVQLSAEGGRGLPCPSTAEPLKLMVSPTFQANDHAGEMIVGTGGGPILMINGLLTSERPSESVIFRRTLYCPSDELVRCRWLGLRSSR